MAIATAAYAVITYWLYQVSKKQVKAAQEQAEAYIQQTTALEELSKAIREIPVKYMSMQRSDMAQEKHSEMIKEITSPRAKGS